MKNSRKFPHTFGEPMNLPEKWELLNYVSIKSRDGLNMYNAGIQYPRAADGIYNFKVRPDDVWVMTFPKSGTTLIQEMVWMIENDDYETAKREPLTKRFPFLEMNTIVPDELVEETKEKLKNDDQKLKNFNEVMSNYWITLENKVGKRYIKTHLPFALLPPELLTSGCKIIYVARNPKDVAVSFFQYCFRDIPDEDFPEFYELFQNNNLAFTPYWNHVIQGWKNRERKNYFFMFYEDIVKDIRSTIKKMANFLEKDMTDEKVEKLAQHLNINNMRLNKSITTVTRSYFIRGKDDFQIVRKGGVGGWRDYFNDELNSKANQWIEENYKHTDLRFPVPLEN